MNNRRSLVILFFFVFSGCYSFTGASIPAHIHTIGIPMMEDNSGFGQPNVRQELTDMLVQKFTNEGSLRVANRSSADAALEGAVMRIMDEPVSVKAGEQVTTKRVTMIVHAVYRDQKKQKVFWERDFSQTADYPISQGLGGLRTALHQAEDKVSSDILIAAISNW